MALIFTDTLQASDSTGLYTLQARIDGQWTDIHTISGAQNGRIEVDATINTIPVDTSLLPVGQTFDFKWVDSIGNESNVVSALVPFTILDYYTAQEDITVTNNGGDSWTFNIPYTPPANDAADYVNNNISFYSDSGITTLVNEVAINSSQAYSFSGNGPGTYMIEILYSNNSQADINISTAFIMVDGSGNVLRQLILTGFSAVTFSGMNLSCTANYSIVNATMEVGVYFVLDSNFANQQSVSYSNPLLNQQIPALTTTNLVIAYGIQLDQSQWTTGVAAPGNLTGCIMTLKTDIV